MEHEPECINRKYIELFCRNRPGNILAEDFKGPDGSENLAIIQQVSIDCRIVSTFHFKQTDETCQYKVKCNICMQLLYTFLLTFKCPLWIPLMSRAVLEAVSF